MEVVNLDRRWAALIEPEWIERLDRTEFLTRCRNGTVTHRELRRFVVQHSFYSQHFTRYLCALLSNMVNDSDRRELMENLFDEMGFGEPGAVPHSVLYRSMMEAMGLDPKKASPFPSTVQLVDTMLDSCKHPRSIVGLGALGLGAEAIVPHLFSQLVTGFRQNGEPEVNLQFFLVHIEADDEHATTMKRIIEREIEEDPSARELLREAARKSIEARARFFDGIMENGES